MPPDDSKPHRRVSSPPPATAVHATAAPATAPPATASEATAATEDAGARAAGDSATEADVAAGDAALPDLLDERGPERHYVVRALLLAGAVVCFVLGVIGWLMPVMTGIPFYILSAVLAGMASRRAAAFLNRQERRLPRRVRLLLRPKQRRARRDRDRAARGG